MYHKNVIMYILHTNVFYKRASSSGNLHRERRGMTEILLAEALNTIESKQTVLIGMAID